MNHHIITEMGRQSFTQRQTAIGGDILLEIPRNNLVAIVANVNFVQLQINEPIKVFSTAMETMFTTATM